MITFECDCPHQDTTWPNTAAYAQKIRAGLSEDEVTKIVRDNAIELFDLDPMLPIQPKQGD